VLLAAVLLATGAIVPAAAADQAWWCNIAPSLCSKEDVPGGIQAKPEEGDAATRGMTSEQPPATTAPAPEATPTPPAEPAPEATTPPAEEKK
jgi:hypothetical protein